MLLRVAQVKCYNCGRACGEVSGKSLQDLNLGNVRGCGPDEGAGAGPSRCGRCGGLVYIDEPFTAGAEELLPVVTAAGIRRNAGFEGPLATQASRTRARSLRRRGITLKERVSNDDHVAAAA